MAGKVVALASDGTFVFEADTGSDTPLGSPAVYDWYGTEQNVVLLPAGNKIYGWNKNGELLPKFPFKLSEQITSPLLISDIDGDGQPEAFAATADRKLHALNGRGENIEGWPVSTNSQVTTQPAVGEYQKEKTIFTFSGNAAHAWRADGTSPAYFPAFFEAPLEGSPVIFDNNVLGNASDGKIYAIGADPLFTAASSASSPSAAEALYISSSSLTGTPVIYDMQAYSNGKAFNNPLIITADVNGSLYVSTKAGKLLFNTNMGQPAASSFSPAVSDINRDGIPNILTLGSYGRLYVWESTNGKRLDIVPSASMKYPVVSDLNEDGYAELIAQTSEGLQCWTIYGE